MMIIKNCNNCGYCYPVVCGWNKNNHNDLCDGESKWIPLNEVWCNEHIKFETRLIRRKYKSMLREAEVKVEEETE